MNEHISTFRQTPKTKVGWAAFILACVALCSGPIMGVVAAVVVPFFSLQTNDKVGQIVGFMAMGILAAVLIAMIVCSIKAFAVGERSWAVLLSLAFACLSVLFWTFMIVGEFVFPH